MNVKDFFRFVMWYFDYIGQKCFDNSAPMIQTVIKVRQNERLPFVVIAYLLMMVSLLLAILHPARFLLSIAIMIVAIGLLSLCRFSLIYYFFLYVRYCNENTSINDRLIVYECILLDPTNEIRKMIASHFRIVDVRGNIFALKFLLSDKRKRNKRKLSKNDMFIIEFKPNAVLLDKKEVYVGKLHDLVDLEKLMCKIQNNITAG